MMERSAKRVAVVTVALVAMAMVVVALTRVVERVQAESAPYHAAKAAASTGVSAAAKRLDGWRVIGPGGGGALYNAAISPLDPALMLISCDMGGNYISHDGGKSWRMFNLWAMNKFAFDAKDARRIYAASGGMVWRSEDAGDSWGLVSPQVSAMKGINFTDDEGGVLVEKGSWSEPITAIAADPEESGTLYGLSGAEAMVSRDAGKNWKAITAVRGTFKILVDTQSAVKNRTLYFIGRDHVASYVAGHLTENPPFMEKAWITEADGGFAPGKSVIYVLTDERFAGKEPQVVGGLLASYDGGKTWKQVSAPLLKDLRDKWKVPDLRAVAVAKNDPELIYLSYGDLRRASDANAYLGVAKSEDGGATWSLPWKTGAKEPANIHDVWVSERFGTDWGENPLSLGADAADAKLVLAGDLGRCMRTSDGGANWYACYSAKMPGETFTTAGIDVNVAYGVFFDPFDLNRMYIANTDISVFRSENGGDSWTSSNKGIPFQWRNAMYWMVFDPQVQGKMWAVVSNKHDLPKDRILHFAPSSYKGGIMVSNDGGNTWEKSGSVPQAAYTHIILQAGGGAAKRVLYAAAMGKGVYKSEDSGETWTLKAEGLPENPYAWRLADDGKGTLYLITARHSKAKVPADDGAVYKSSDAGEHWTRLLLPSGLNGPMDVAIDPQQPARLVLAAWSNTDPIMSRHQQGGVFVSEDGSGHWRRTLRADWAFSVTIDPGDGNVVYAAGQEASVWRSADRGNTWRRIRGFNFKNAHRVIVDPRNEKMIYVATDGGGVWYGPAEGDAGAKEDIATPEVSFERIAREHLGH